MAHEEQFDEYVTFHVTSKAGKDVEMAVVDEFDFEKAHYVVAAEVRDDTLVEDGYYIYQAIVRPDGDFEVKPIRKAFDYRRIAEAYAEISSDDEEEIASEEKDSEE